MDHSDRCLEMCRLRLIIDTMYYSIELQKKEEESINIWFFSANNRFIEKDCRTGFRQEMLPFLLRFSRDCDKMGKNQRRDSP